MADNFGLKIGVEGEKEFKNALRDINQSFKVLGSEMQLVTSQFDRNDKSIQAVTARNEVLNKEIDQQKTKIETLRSALDNAAESFGETDKRTQNWQIQLNKAEAELNNMERELGDNEAALDGVGAEFDATAKDADKFGAGVEDAAEQTDKAGGRFEKLGGILKGIGAAMGAVAVAAGAAAIKLGKEVLNAYADYEQLVGGVDTLFKDSSQAVQDYAANAYKTAGMSANQYMETVTGFSASLIQSLGGDTEKAAKIADMAITDMSDNANKMGTDISSIQSAYQGFAKQNYTMLDNLKLGYGGTKTEMERLLADAEKFSGIKYDISSYADVAQAIHVIQEEMGIMGSLLQAICRTNRVYKGKTHGLIVDYLGIFDNVATALNYDDKSVQNAITNIGEVVSKIPEWVEKCLSYFPNIDRTIAGYEGLIAAQECLPNNEIRDKFAADYSVLSKAWEAISPHPSLSEYMHDYKWLSQVYESIKPPSGRGKLLWHALGAKTIELVHENITLDSIDDDLETLILDADVLEGLLKTLNANKKAKEIEIKLIARFRKHKGNSAFEALGERLERIKEQHEQGLMNSISYLKALLELAKDTIKAEQETDETNEQDEAKAALTDLFAESRNESTPIIVERIVKDIGEIVRMVRFPDWQTTTAGERLIRKELRYLLYIKYKLPDQELFDKAYSYIKMYY